MHTCVNLFIGAVFLASMSLPVAAGDGVLVITPSKGACGEWVKARSNAKLEPVVSESFKWWLIGYLGGFAMGTETNYLNGASAESIYLWMDNYCQQNPLKGVVEGAFPLVKELKAQRGLK